MALIKSKINNTTYSWKSDDIRDGEINAIIENGCCNILPAYRGTYTENGVVFTANSDGIVTVDATQTGRTQGAFWFSELFSVKSTLTYSVSGCPSNGSLSTYCLGIDDATNSTKATDTGEGDSFIGQTSVKSWIYVHPNFIGTLTFRPMVYDARLNPTGYVQHAKTNKQLTEQLRDGLIPKINLFSVYGRAETPINIDLINWDGYMLFIEEGEGFSGAPLTSIFGGTSYVLIGLSSVYNGGLGWGGQIAIGFGGTKIAMRHCPYNQQYGGLWSEWRILTAHNTSIGVIQYRYDNYTGADTNNLYTIPLQGNDIYILSVLVTNPVNVYASNPTNTGTNYGKSIRLYNYDGTPYLGAASITTIWQTMGA